MIRLLHDRAKSAPKRLVFAEATKWTFLRLLKLFLKNLSLYPILLGDRKKLKSCAILLNLMKTLK